MINYNKKFGDHNFDVLLGHESFAYKYQYNYTMRQGQVMDGLMELGNFTTINSAYSYTDEYKKKVILPVSTMTSWINIMYQPPTAVMVAHASTKITVGVTSGLSEPLGV